MRVVLIALRCGVVDHVRDVRHVNATRRHICCHEDIGRVALELAQCALPLTLRLVAVDGIAAKATGVERLAKPVRAALGFFKDNYLAVVVVRQDIVQLLQLVRAVTVKDDILLDTVARVTRLDGDHLRAIAEVINQFTHARIHRRGEKVRLALRGTRAKDRAHIAHKPHVQHAIHFVQHDNIERRQCQCGTLHVVLDAPRRANDNARPTLEVGELWSHGCAANQQRRGHARHPLRKRAHLLQDLLCELARRRNHQHARCRLLDEAVDDGNSKRHRLAGPGIGNANHVTPGQRHGDSPVLDG